MNDDDELKDYGKATLRSEGCTCDPDVELRVASDGMPEIHLLHEVECVLVLNWKFQQ
jgi:hypothetical protein